MSAEQIEREVVDKLRVLPPDTHGFSSLTYTEQITFLLFRKMADAALAADLRA